MTAVERRILRPGYEISRIIRGGWQLAGGHGSVDAAAAVADLVATAEAGITTFDCADIYTGVEELIGACRVEIARTNGAEALATLRVHTKCVPDLDKLAGLKRAEVRAIVERSLRRLHAERLDLVQFHWWDYAVSGYLEAAHWLDELRWEGKIELLGGTNFDTAHTSELLAAGIPIASMQVQYSLLDDRPEHGLIELCGRHKVHLLCYGTVAGGFLSLAACNIVAILQFGVVLAMGMMLTWLANMTVLPIALRALRPRGAAAEAPDTAASRAFRRFVLWIERVVVERPGRVVLAAAAIVAIGTFFATRVGIGSFVYDDLRPGSPLGKRLSKATEVYGGTVPLADFVEPSLPFAT